MKKSIKITSNKKPCYKGLNGIAQSFISVGIPRIIESSLEAECSGLNNYLVKNGNYPISLSKKKLKIKL